MILLHGYYGERNAGDDAFTTVCVDQLAPRFGPVRVMTTELPRIPALPAKALLLRRRWWGLAPHVERHRIQAVLSAVTTIDAGGSGSTIIAASSSTIRGFTITGMGELAD